MFISIDEFERISDIFAISAYFLFTGINAYRMFVHGRGHLQDVTAWLLVWWTILVFDKFIAYFFDHNTIDGAHAQTIYKCLANMVDMTCAVGCVMVAYTLSYVRRVTFLTVLTHASPYILCIISYLLTYDKLWMWVAFFWTIIYGLFYFFFFMSKFKAYTKRMKAAYSNDTSRNLDWLQIFCWTFLGVLITWAIPAYLEIVGAYVISSIGGIVMWHFAFNNIIQQEPVDISYSADKKPLTETSETKECKESHQPEKVETIPQPEHFDTAHDKNDKRFAFAPQMEKLFNEEKVYLNTDLTINDLAQMMCTNRAYVSAYLNNVIHMSFYDYVNNMRIKRSIELLRREEKTIESIASESGFNTSYSFRRVFAKAMNCTPTEWRKLSKEEQNKRIETFDNSCNN